MRVEVEKSVGCHQRKTKYENIYQEVKIAPQLLFTKIEKQLMKKSRHLNIIQLDLKKKTQIFQSEG